MNLVEYSGKIENTKVNYLNIANEQEQYTQLILGLFEEASEVVSPIRKYTCEGNFHQASIDITHITEEFGDVLWYITQLGNVTGISLDDIAKFNLQKTYLRFGQDLSLIEKLEAIGLDEYQKLSQKTVSSKIPEDPKERLKFVATGIIKEVGIIAGKFGEYRIDERTLEIDKIQEKLGDCLWYITACASALGIRLEDIAQLNVDKANMRYTNNVRNVERD